VIYSRDALSVTLKATLHTFYNIGGRHFAAVNRLGVLARFIAPHAMEDVVCMELLDLR